MEQAYDYVRQRLSIFDPAEARQRSEAVRQDVSREFLLSPEDSAKVVNSYLSLIAA
jgi:hypothetical protein